jgi:ABC-2 type transport system permease protein
MSTVTASQASVHRTLVVADRELRTLLRSRIVQLLAVGFLAIVLVLGWFGNAGGGYVPLALTLTSPLEVLIPLLGFALGYRAVYDQRVRGELAVARTYPVGPVAYVAGVFLGRAVVLLVTVIVGVASAGLLVALFQSESVSVLAAHATADSPLLYVRLVFLSALYALAALAVALAVSASLATTRNALAVAVVVVVAFVLGGDVGAIAALSGGPEGAATALVALSPPSAFRSLVLALVVRPVAPQFGPTVSPLLTGTGLLAWIGGALAIAAAVIHR